MKKDRYSGISDSEESEESAEHGESTSKNASTNNHEDSSSEFSSEDERTRPPTPPVEEKKKERSTSPQKRVTFNPLERFVSQNENLTKLIVNDVICEDDDVCILEVPKTLDASLFLEKLVNFDRKTKIKLNHTKYIIEPDIEVKPVNLLTQKLKIVHPISILTLREYKKHKHEGEAVETPISPPSIPGNLKVRHPLFGAEYKRKIVLNEEIQRKLDDTLEKAVKKMKKKQQKMVESLTHDAKKKHKKKRNIESEAPQPEQENTREEESIFSLLETHIAGKKKKSFQEGETSASDSICAGEDVSKRKHKNSVKEEKNSTESPEFGEKKKKRKNSTKEERASSQEPVEAQKKKQKTSFQEQNDSTSSNHEDKKKRKHSIKEEMLSQDEAEDSPKQDKRKRKNSAKAGDEDTRRRSSIINSTVIPDLQLPFFEFDVSCIGNKEEVHNNSKDKVNNIGKSPKKKKESDESLNTSAHDESSVQQKRKHVEEEDGETSSPKKKSKKVKEEPEDEATNSLILNLLNKVKTEMGTSTKPKKKRKSEN